MTAAALSYLFLVLVPSYGTAAPKAPGAFCAQGKTLDCAAEGVAPPPSEAITDARKWNPGHYMQMLLGDSSDDMQNVRFGWYDQIANNTAIEGVALRLKWGQLESSKGNYTFATLHAELDKLKSLAHPKRLFIRLHERDYGTSGCNSSMFPSYLRNSTGCALAAHGNVARIWDPVVADRLIALYKAIAAEFDDDPYFEGLMLIRETATNGEVLDGSYSHGAYLSQLKRLAKAASEAFKKSNVVMSVNWLADQETVDELVTYSAEVGIGQGGPDVLPDGIAKQRPHAYNALDGSSTGVDLRKRMPVIYSIEPTQLGGNLCSRCMPSDLHQFAEERLGASHLLWTRSDYIGSSAQKWPSGILPWINDHPLRNEACPTSYASCSTGE